MISRTPASASLDTIPEYSELPPRPPDLVPAPIPVPPPPLPSLEPPDRLDESQEPPEPPEILKEHLMAYTHLPSTASQDITVSTQSIARKSERNTEHKRPDYRALAGYTVTRENKDTLLRRYFTSLKANQFLIRHEIPKTYRIARYGAN